MSLDYIPEPSVPASSASSVQATAGASMLEVRADIHQKFDDVDTGEVEILDSTQEGNQVTQS